MRKIEHDKKIIRAATAGDEERPKPSRRKDTTLIVHVRRPKSWRFMHNDTEPEMIIDKTKSQHKNEKAAADALAARIQFYKELDRGRGLFTVVDHTIT